MELFVVVDEKITPAAIQRATGWALFSACGAVLSLALGQAVDYALAQYYGTLAVGCSQSSFVLWCVALTDAQAAEHNTFWFGWLCCALLQAAAAVMALRMPFCRRVLACLALVLTLVGHCMHAAAVRLLLAAHPGYIFVRIFCTGNIVMFAWGDLLCFLGLLREREVRTE